MIIGIDVYHNPDRRHSSRLAFVASINAYFTKYFSTSREQRDELGDTLSMCLVKSLESYHNNNDCLPERIIVYRDGVGDGRFNMVLEHEIPQFQKAFSHFGANYNPKFTWINVSKRINTRILGIGPNNCAENPPPGTVVDHTITEKSNYTNFFLVSQKVGEGTVSPTHYTVLYDNADTSADHVQRLTYKLTHMYYNWPGAIRVPAMCQYAHKLAGLIGQYVKKDHHESLNENLFFI